MIKNWKLFTESARKYVNVTEIPYEGFIEFDQKSQQTILKFFEDRNFKLRDTSIPYWMRSLHGNEVDEDFPNFYITDDKLRIQAMWESKYEGSYLYTNILLISMTDDEWYYVKHHKQYSDVPSTNYLFKCDQLDGLMECLSDTVPVYK